MRTLSPRGAPMGRSTLSQLPSIFQGEGVLSQFLSGLDDVMAPITTTLDCLHAYIDPSVTPADFLGWLGGWVGLTLAEQWPEDRRRLLVSRAAVIYANRGTLGGLREELELCTGGRVEVRDGAGVRTSRRPRDVASWPVARRPIGPVLVTVEVGDLEAVGEAAVRALVEEAVPAHVPFELELRVRGSTERGETS